MPLIRQEEIYPVAVTPFAQAIEMVATAAIALNDIIVVDNVVGSLPKASPAILLGLQSETPCTFRLVETFH